MKKINVYKRHSNSTSLEYNPDEFDKIASIRINCITCIMQPKVKLYKKEGIYCVEWSLETAIQRMIKGECYQHDYDFYRGFDHRGEYGWASIDQIIYIPSREPDGTPCLVNVKDDFENEWQNEWHGREKAVIMDEMMDMVCKEWNNKTYDEMLNK